MQTANSGRVVTLVAVSNGQVRVADAGDTAWTTPVNSTGETPPLNITGPVFSACLNQVMYFVDGTNAIKYTPATNTLAAWTATAGTFPEDSEENLPRIVAGPWRGRLVLFGLPEDPQNWFLTAVDDATDFDYSPPSLTLTQAIAGNIAPQGLIGDVLNGFLPFTDDVGIWFGDHSIHYMRGDPMNGGQIDLVTNAVGAAWGEAFCMDPYGTVYFFSNGCGVYSLVPGQAPTRISQPIESLLDDIDTGANTIRLLWNDRQQGFHVFVTPIAAPTTATHFFYEARTGAWWTDTFADNNYNPLCCCTFDGNEADDRVQLIGSWDGYVRAFNPTAVKDDRKNIASSVVLGPITTKDLDDMMLFNFQAVLGTASNDVTFSVYVGRTAEEALSNSPIATGTWAAGRNFTNSIRRAAHAIYVKITASSPWALESIRLHVAAMGKVRRRG